MTIASPEGWENASLYEALNFLTIEADDILHGHGVLPESETLYLRAEGAGIALVALRDLSGLAIDLKDSRLAPNNRVIVEPQQVHGDDEIRGHARRVQGVVSTLREHLEAGLITASTKWIERVTGVAAVLDLLRMIEDDGLPHPLDLDERFLDLLLVGTEPPGSAACESAEGCA
jgi:hypothetical protein